MLRRKSVIRTTGNYKIWIIGSTNILKEILLMAILAYAFRQDLIDKECDLIKKKYRMM
jgi:hypothetical protein